MQLTDAELAEFKKLVQEEYGIELSDDEARVQAEQFAQFMYPLLRHAAQQASE